MAARRRWLWWFLGCVAAGLAFVVFAEVYTEWLWYRSDAYPIVFVRRWSTQIGLFAIAFGLLFAFLRANLRFADRSGLRLLPADDSDEELWAWLDGIVRPAVAWLPWVGAAVGGLATSQSWQMWLVAFAGVPFGSRDPQFGLDTGFYVYRLGAWSQLLTNVNTVLLSTLAAIIVIYFARRQINLSSDEATFSVKARRHLLLLAALLLLARAGGLWLRRYQLLLSSTGLFPGAGWTDVHVRLPGLLLGCATAVIAAAVCLWIRRPGRRAYYGYWAVGLHLGLHALAAGIAPSVAQRVLVRPNEVDREAPYIARAIDGTRRAFNLDLVHDEPFTASPVLSAADLARNAGTLDNVRVWDHRPLLRTHKQLQEIRQYYDIIDVDSDRYVLGGKSKQVLVSAREMNQAQLDEKAGSWVNQHLEYTHGFGLVMSLASKVEGEGQPGFVARDVPPVTVPEIPIVEPRIYFGEGILLPPDPSENSRPILPGAAERPTPQPDETAERRRRRLNDVGEPDGSDYLLVNTNRDEFDYPQTVNGSEVRQRNRYAGKTGVPVGGLWRRLLFGIRLRSTELLLTRFATADSRLLIHRQITRRCTLAAPFLVWDTSPYPVVVDGRIQWVCEAYTMSQSYPYSEIHLESEVTPQGTRLTPTWNYLRNPVKGVVDAYDGTVKFYVVDEKDPLVRTFARIYPGVLHPASEAPAELRAHFRYPQMLFRTQADMYQRYHMNEVGQFYSSEDLWTTARTFRDEVAANVDRAKLRNQPELFGPMAPYYIEMNLPGERSAQFMLLSAYTPFNAKERSPRDNMIAYLVGLCDGDRYGEMRVYRFPKDRTIYGPLQVEALINQDEAISQLLTLWDKGGSKVIRGQLLTVPVAQSLLYVQPLYLEASNKGLPELKRVVVVHEQQVAMAPTFAEALERIFGPVPELSEAPTVKPAPAPEAPQAPGTPRSLDRELVAQAQRAFDEVEAATRAGDWARVQDAQTRLGDVLKKLGR